MSTATDRGPVSFPCFFERRWVAVAAGHIVDILVPRFKAARVTGLTMEPLGRKSRDPTRLLKPMGPDIILTKMNPLQIPIVWSTDVLAARVETARMALGADDRYEIQIQTTCYEPTLQAKRRPTYLPSTQTRRKAIATGSTPQNTKPRFKTMS